MKRVFFYGAIAFASIAFTSCEKDNSETTPENESVSTRQPLSVDLPSAKTLDGKPQTIQELRNEGISVSQGLADYVGSLRTLLWAANKSINEANELITVYFFYPSEIVELRIIKAKYDALTTPPATEQKGNTPIGSIEELITGESNTPNPGQGPTTAPNATPVSETGSFAERYDFPKDVIDLIIDKNTGFSGGVNAVYEKFEKLENSLANNEQGYKALGNGLYEVKILNSAQGNGQLVPVTRNLKEIEAFIYGKLISISGANGRFDSPNLDSTFDRVAIALAKKLVDSL